MRKFKNYNELSYHSLYGDPIGNISDARTILFDYLQDEYKEYGEIVSEVIFGTDTENKGRLTRFGTALALRKEGKGVRIIRCRYAIPLISSMNERLMLEAIRANEFALLFADILDNFAVIPTIHADINQNEIHKSNRVMKQVFGLIESQGYNCVMKPDAWVSSKVCDKIVKKKGSWSKV